MIMAHTVEETKTTDSDQCHKSHKKFKMNSMINEDLLIH